ncbi:MAG: class I SAM-dependent methyltransferase [Dehalococcoidia bacterium]
MAEISAAKLSIDPALLPAGPQRRVLDAGCGDGRHIVEAARRGARAVGLDYDVAELRRAQARAGALYVDVVAGDASRLPFRAGVFDAVICTETLEHLADDHGAVREIARVLREGGLLLGAVPSHFTELLYWKLSRGYWQTPGGHLRIYQPRPLARMLAAAGLPLESVRYLHFVDSLFWLRFCLSDFLRPRRARSAFAQAVALAVAQERATPAWRRRLRAAFGRSRFIAALDAAGAYVWPKSFVFAARKAAASADGFGRPGESPIRAPRPPDTMC